MLRDHWPAIMLLTIILFDDKVGCISLISTSSSYRDCWCFPQAMEIRWSIHYITKYMIVSLVETYSFCTQCSLTCCLIVNLCLFLNFYFQDNLTFYDVLAMVNFQLRLHALINEKLLLLSNRLLSHCFVHNLMLIFLSYSLKIMWVTRWTTSVSKSNNNGGEKWGWFRNRGW